MICLAYTIHICREVYKIQMSLNTCIVGCKVITLIGSETTDVVYEDFMNAYDDQQSHRWPWLQVKWNR